MALALAAIFSIISSAAYIVCNYFEAIYDRKVPQQKDVIETRLYEGTDPEVLTRDYCPQSTEVDFPNIYDTSSSDRKGRIGSF